MTKASIERRRMVRRLRRFVRNEEAKLDGCHKAGKFLEIARESFDILRSAIKLMQAGAQRRAKGRDRCRTK